MIDKKSDTKKNNGIVLDSVFLVTLIIMFIFYSEYIILPFILLVLYGYYALHIELKFIFSHLELNKEEHDRLMHRLNMIF